MQFVVKTVLYVAMQRIAWILSSVGLVLEGIADILDGNVWEGIKKVGLGLLDLMNPIGGLQDGFKSLWEKVASGALSAWEGIKNAFKSVPEWFQGKFRDAWQKVKDVFSTGGRIWSGIKEGIESTFRAVVNAIIRGMNTIIAVPFNKINSMLNTIRNAHFLGISPFQNMWGVNPLPVPQIPMLRAARSSRRTGSSLPCWATSATATTWKRRNPCCARSCAKKPAALAADMNSSRVWIVARCLTKSSPKQNCGKGKRAKTRL